MPRPETAEDTLEGTAQDMRIVRCELGAEEVVGAILWSLLLYPSDQEADERANHCAALMAKCVAAEPDADRREEIIGWLPGQIDLDPAAIKAGLSGSRRRARDRLLAGWMLLQRLGVGVRPSGAAPPNRRPSIQALVERVMRMASQSHVTNVINRLWKPSHPVLHLAAAYQVVASEAEVGEGETADLVLGDRSLNDRIVSLASEIVDHVRADASFAHWAAKLIHIDLVA